jgi:FG-GAP-like repeat
MRPILVALILVEAGLASCGLPFSKAVSGPTSIRFVTGSEPASVELADLHGVGKTDIVIANTGSDSVTILLGDGHGGFKPSSGSPFPAGHAPNDVAIADINGDGNADLAFPNHETKFVTILFGDGRGGFSPAPQSPLTVESKPHPHGIICADFNGDHHMDLAVESWQTNQVEVFTGDGRGNFALPGLFVPVGKMPYQRLRTGDFNKDRYADIVTTNLEGSSVTILLGDGKGGFKEASGSPFPAGKSPFGVAVGDINKDGNADLVVANYSGRPDNLKDDGVTVLLGDGNGVFRAVAGSPFPTGNAPTRVAIGDVDGDGSPDIAVCNSQSHNVTILRGNGKGGFEAGYNIDVGHEPNGVALGDLNGDGKADIVVANSKDNDVLVILSH